jgi:hypothetical protein
LTAFSFIVNNVTRFEKHVSEVVFAQQRIQNFRGNWPVEALIRGNAQATETELLETYFLCGPSGVRGVQVKELDEVRVQVCPGGQESLREPQLKRPRFRELVLEDLFQDRSRDPGSF